MRHRIIQEIASSVVAAGGVDNVIRALVESTTLGTEAKGCSFLTLSADNRHLFHRITYGMSEDYPYTQQILEREAKEQVLK